MSRFIILLFFSIVSAKIFAIPFGVGQPCSNRVYWDALENNSTVQIILKDADKKLVQPFPEWNQSVYDEFFRNGNRTSAENMLNARKMFLFPLVIAECVRNDRRYLNKISEVLISLALQPSWVLPAHVGIESNKKDKPFIFDLFSSEITVELAQALFLLGNALPKEVIKKVDEEIYSRVVMPVEYHFDDFIKQNWWFGAKNNWVAVSGRGLYFIIVNYSKNSEAKKKILSLLDRKFEDYKNSFAVDGYADEGLDYWSYGLSHYAELEFFKKNLLKIPIQEWPSLPSVAMFRRKFEMAGGIYASVGDSIYGKKSDLFVDYWYLKNSRVNKNLVLPYSSAMNNASLFRFPMIAFYEGDQSISIDAIQNYSYFASSGVLVYRPKKIDGISFVFKGGLSKSHAHNDSGSFSLSRNGRISIGDIGRAVYTRESFGKNRSEQLTVSSFGHSVPVIDGRYQKSYPEVQEVPVVSNIADNFVSVRASLGRLYGESTDAYIRELKSLGSDGNKIILHDQFNFMKNVEVEEAFVTREIVKMLGDSKVEFGDTLAVVCMSVIKPSGIKFAIKSFSDGKLQFSRVAAALPPGASDFIANFSPGNCN